MKSSSHYNSSQEIYFFLFYNEDTEPQRNKITDQTKMQQRQDFHPDLLKLKVCALIILVRK